MPYNRIENILFYLFSYNLTFDETDTICLEQRTEFKS